MAMRPEIQRWIEQAEYELSVAQIMLETKKHSACVFHCQQAIEMALKAVFMLQHGTEPPRTHSLVSLGEQTNTQQKFDTLFRELTPAYTDARYPDATIESPEVVYGGDRSSRLYNLTVEFFAWIRLELARISKNS
ncbi:HEPN domain-containing protein [candidate division KSB1 bacterium]|nr:MAG: HEPN domain-containing protein [candidate division KSB1 bacterium]